MKINAILTSFWSNAKTYLSNNYLSKTDVASKDTLGGVKTTSTVTSTSGLTATPIIDGVPYYKDTNTTYSAMSASEATTGTATTARTITAKVLNDKIDEKISGKANDSEVVHLTGDETIEGIKDFTSTQKMKGLVINPTASIHREFYGNTEGAIGPYGAGAVPESNTNPFRFYVGTARNYASAPIVIDTGMGPTGNTSIVLRAASNESENVLDHRVNIGTTVTNNSDGTKTRNAYVQFYNTNEIRSSSDNKALLGTTDRRWADVNTVLLNGKTPSYEGHTHTEYLGKTDKATSATTADKITLTDTNPTSATSYQITFASSTSNNGQRVNNGLKYYTLEGTESANGYGQLFLGNSTNNGVAGNKYGNIRLYSKSSNYAVISGNTSLTGTRTLTVPDATGTLICTGNLTTTLGSGSSAGGLSDASIGIGSLVLGFVNVDNMASAISSTKSNGFLNISGSSIRLASLCSKSAPSDLGFVAEVTYATTTLSGTWRFLGYSTQSVSGTRTSNLGTLGLFIRIA